MRDYLARASLLLVSALGLFVSWLARTVGQSLSLRADPFNWAPFAVFLLCMASCIVPRVLMPLLGIVLGVGLLLLAVFWEAYDALFITLCSVALGALWWAAYRERTRGPRRVSPRLSRQPINKTPSQPTNSPNTSKLIRGEIQQKY